MSGLRSPKTRKPGTAQRAIRVFVSSTFRDMQAERDELVKRTFPQLRKLCDERGVTWGEVDLRWGISEEEKAEGRVLPICLAEIRNCRPYFIGLLGELYGWVPESIDSELVAREPWLERYPDRSVTELEIVHAVLADPAKAEHSFFYLRDPAYTDERPEFRETPAKEEIAAFGAAEAQRRAEERRCKLVALKESIRVCGLPVRENYPDPKALGELVLADLTELINRLYPEGSRLEPLDQEAAEHEAFTRSRLGVYVGRKEYTERLDEHFGGDGPPLVVLGEPGSGKSALLANWALSDQRTRAEDLLLVHFVGATPASADWAAMVRRILGEFRRRFDLALEVPDQAAALRTAFANGLHMAAARGRIGLIIDSLNQLEDRDAALDLAWLPRELPPNVRLIVSTLPGRPLDELRRRSWPVLEVQPLEPGERRRLIVDYLAQYSKTLSAERMQRIAAAQQTASPLYLRALLEELRVWGVHERLDELIGRYLAAATADRLYEKILERYEQDYERDRPGLVCDATSLLWAARRGLSEAELLDLLGTDSEPLPRAQWSPLFLAAEQSLVSRSGLIGYFHDYLRQAVKHRYLDTPERRQIAHLRLARYFTAQDPGPRKVAELPWQLQQAEQWTLLYRLLADVSFFAAAWDADQFDVKMFWAQVEGHSPLRLVDAYWPFSGQAGLAGKVAILLSDTGHLEQALSLCQGLAEGSREVGDVATLEVALGRQAGILMDLGDLGRAMALREEQERMCRELGDRKSLALTLGNQAVILMRLGDLDRAMTLCQEQERMCRELGDMRSLAHSLGNQASILQDSGDIERAMALVREEERICREVGDRVGLAASLGEQAALLHQGGEPDRAMALLKEQERMCREVGDKSQLADSLGNQAVIVYEREDLHAALALHREEEQLCRELGEPLALATCLANQADLLAWKMGRQQEALPLAEEAYRLASQHGLMPLAQKAEAVMHMVRYLSGIERPRPQGDET